MKHVMEQSYCSYDLLIVARRVLMETMTLWLKRNIECTWSPPMHIDQSLILSLLNQQLLCNCLTILQSNHNQILSTRLSAQISLYSKKKPEKKYLLHLWCSSVLLIMNLSEDGRHGSARLFINSLLFKWPQPWVISLIFRQHLKIFWRVSFRTAGLHDILNPRNEDIIFGHRSSNEQGLDVSPPVVRTEPGDMAA